MQPTLYGFEMFREVEKVPNVSVKRTQPNANDWITVITANGGDILLKSDQLEFVIDALVEIAGRELDILYVKNPKDEMPF